MIIKINEVKTYTFEEFREIQENRELINKLNLIEKSIDHIKNNKYTYLKLVFFIAITIDKGTLTAFASGSLENNLMNKATFIIDKLIMLAKYACMGMGLKDMVICLLNGGNMKEASFSGIQYWLGYLFLQFYPQLYV